MKELGPQEYVYEECLNLGKMRFEFAEKGDPLSTCVSFAGRM